VRHGDQRRAAWDRAGIQVALQALGVGVPPEGMIRIRMNGAVRVASLASGVGGESLELGRIVSAMTCATAELGVPEAQLKFCFRVVEALGGPARAHAMTVVARTVLEPLAVTRHRRMATLARDVGAATATRTV